MEMTSVGGHLVRPAPWPAIGEVERFAAECLQPMPGQWVSVQAVYTAWLRWLAERGLGDLSRVSVKIVAKVLHQAGYQAGRRYWHSYRRRVILDVWPLRGDLFPEKIFRM